MKSWNAKVFFYNTWNRPLFVISYRVQLLRLPVEDCGCTSCRFQSCPTRGLCHCQLCRGQLCRLQRCHDGQAIRPYLLRLLPRLLLVTSPVKEVETNAAWARVSGKAKKQKAQINNNSRQSIDLFMRVLLFLFSSITL